MEFDWLNGCCWLHLDWYITHSISSQFITKCYNDILGNGQSSTWSLTSDVDVIAVLIDYIFICPFGPEGVDSCATRDNLVISIQNWWLETIINQIDQEGKVVIQKLVKSLQEFDWYFTNHICYSSYLMQIFWWNFLFLVHINSKQSILISLDKHPSKIFLKYM